MNAPHVEEFLTLQEIIAAARRNLAPGPWSYLIGGTETETTVRRNRHALDSIAFRPRVLRDVSRIDSSGTFLGTKTRLPVMLAPIGGLESIVEGGAATAARGAAQFNVPQMLSSVCQPGLEQTAAAAATVRSFQLYVRGDDAWVDDWVRRAKDKGFGSFCLTVDVAAYSRRERDLLGRFVKPWRAKAIEGAAFQAGLSWDHVKRYKDKHNGPHALPLILKGIVTAEDAEVAVEHGVEVVYVSNHGGRQLDQAPASLEVLPAIKAAVGDKMTVMLDSGVRRGADILIALCLGADFCFYGRPTLYGAVAYGLPGVKKAIDIFRGEIDLVMGQIGCPSLDQLGPDFLWQDDWPRNR
jgi:glycolate oxidase